MSNSFYEAKLTIQIIEKDLKSQFPHLQKLDMEILVHVNKLLSEEEGMPSMKRLSQVSKYSSPLISKSKDRLLKSKLITVDRDPEDMRIKLIGLTPLGQKLAKQIDSTLDEICENTPIYGKRES